MTTKERELPEIPFYLQAEIGVQDALLASVETAYFATKKDLATLKERFAEAKRAQGFNLPPESADPATQRLRHELKNAFWVAIDRLELAHAALKVSMQSLSGPAKRARFEVDPGYWMQEGQVWSRAPGALDRIRSNLARCSAVLEAAYEEYFLVQTWIASLPVGKREAAEESIMHLCYRGELGSFERKYVMGYGTVGEAPTFADGTKNVPEFPRMTLAQARAALATWRPAWIGEYKERFPHRDWYIGIYDVEQGKVIESRRPY